MEERGERRRDGKVEWFRWEGGLDSNCRGVRKGEVSSDENVALIEVVFLVLGHLTGA